MIAQNDFGVSMVGSTGAGWIAYPKTGTSGSHWFNIKAMTTCSFLPGQSVQVAASLLHQQGHHIGGLGQLATRVRPRQAASASVERPWGVPARLHG